MKIRDSHDRGEELATLFQQVKVKNEILRLENREDEEINHLQMQNCLQVSQLQTADPEGYGSQGLPEFSHVTDHMKNKVRLQNQMQCIMLKNKNNLYLTR